MKFGYWSARATAEEFSRSQEWQSLRILLEDFKKLASEHDITPILLFIPHKAGVYGELASDRSGDELTRRIGEQLRFQDNSAEALRKLASDLHLRLIDLTPSFRRCAKDGDLLYYPIDTHWNLGGREEAARIVSEVLRETR